MPKLLSEEAVARYREEGWLAPIRVMGEDEAAGLRAALEAVEVRMGGPLRGDLRHKSHLLFPFLAELIRHPRILDAVEDLLGPTSCAGRRASSSRRRPIRALSPGIRIRPIGASPSRRWRPPGWR